MRGVQISYLIDYPEYVPQLAQWLFEQWGAILGEKTLEPRIKKLTAHMNRDQLPIAWVAHANGQLLGTAALRVHDLEERKDLTPWHGGGRGSNARDTDSLSVHTRQAGVVFTPRLETACPLCLA